MAKFTIGPRYKHKVDTSLESVVHGNCENLQGGLTRILQCTVKGNKQYIHNL